MIPPVRYHRSANNQQMEQNQNRERHQQRQLQKHSYYPIDECENQYEQVNCQVGI